MSNVKTVQHAPVVEEQHREATEAEQAAQAHRLDVAAEIDAMRGAFDALHKLTDDGKRRAMRWLDSAIWMPRADYREEPPF